MAEILHQLKVKMSIVEVTRPLHAVTENQPYLGTGRPTNLNLVCGWSMMTCGHILEHENLHH